MHMKDFNPRPSYIVMNGKRYELKPFGAAVHVWAYAEFATKENRNGIEVLSERLRDIQDMSATLQVVYYLLKDKNEWPTYERFAEQVMLLKHPYTKIIEFYHALQECIGHSQPEAPSEEERELKKSVATVA